MERLTPRRVVWQVATVARVVHETTTAKSLLLDVPDWPGHRAGQHLDLRLTAEDGYQAERSYSVSSPPESAQVAITVERVEDGEVSPYLLDEVRAGDELELRGPIGGHFSWSVDDGGPVLMVAGGSGLAPLMAMLRHRAARGADVEVAVLVSARTAGDALFRNEIATLEPRAGLRVAWTFTREPAPPPGAYGRRVDAAMLAEAGIAAPQRPHVFVCGPTPFVETVATLLVDAGHDPHRIHTERFGPTGGS